MMSEESRKLRVWHVTNPPSDPQHLPVDSLEEAIELIEGLSQEDLESESVRGSSIGLEVYEAGKWIEYYDEDGNDIDDIMKIRYERDVESENPWDSIGDAIDEPEESFELDDDIDDLDYKDEY